MTQRSNNSRAKPTLIHNREWVCNYCQITHTLEQLCCIGCNKEKPVTNDTQVTNDKPISQDKNTYKPTNRGFIGCNGDCGSQLSELLDNIVNGQQNANIDSSIISLRFRYFDDPLRQKLLKLMRKKTLFEQLKYKPYYSTLNDNEYYVTDATQVRVVMDLFAMLAKDNHTDILQEIANKTCKDPSWSLLEQISYRKLYDLQDNYKSVQKTISLFAIGNEAKDKDEDEEINIALKVLRSKACKVKQQIEEEKRNVQQQKHLKSFLDRMNTIKTRKQYIKMKKQNASLNDLEILAVLLYTDVDIHCNNMRRSHRNREENSCKYSNLFCHLCSAIDKMWRIFHRNKDKEAQFLFHGNTVSYLSQAAQKKHQKTVTSFTTDLTVATGFANKIKQNPKDKKGMILVIDDANEALASGRMKGASVSWISKHFAENEYLILPSTFCRFRAPTQEEIKDNFWANAVEEYSLYITNDVESMDMSLVTSDIDDQLDTPMLWIPPHIKEYSDLKTAFDKGLSTLGALLGHFRRLECYECNIMSRIMDFTGKWSDLSIQCPSCRALVFRSNKTDDRNRLIQCFNEDCPKQYITRYDLKNVTKNAQDGYKCIHCKQQQKVTHLNNLAKNHVIIEQIADRLLDDMQELLYLNAKYAGGMDEKQANHEIDKQKYKADLMRIISFLNKAENVNASLFDIVKQFPIIWKWVTGIKYVKLILDSYKEGYTDLLNQGVIDTTNDAEITTILQPVQILKPFIDVANVGMKVLNQFTNANNNNDGSSNQSDDENYQVDNEENTDSNSNDGGNDEESFDDRVYYDCPKCEKRVWVYSGTPQVWCKACLAGSVRDVFSLFSFN